MLSKVRIVGSGLIGTSIALGLVQRGVSIQMIDASSSAQSLATDLVGGVEVVDPELVIFALPTSRLPMVIASEFELNPHSTFMDVGSVKGEIALQIETFPGLKTRFVPTHPMAGREIGGAGSARADLFQGRSWILTPNPELLQSSKNLVVEVITTLGASPIELSPSDHDRAVAKISHLP
ncbi:MAG: prephenate dehydrogenase/arogenate dehydrogenase family protein, partial [Actinobacteria bacterium]|nr:prephenate dehydrogenase/arogenate dehydrogenase family protein [Actinomycetota bacterium]